MVVCRSHLSAQISAGSKHSHCALYNCTLAGLASFSIFPALEFLSSPLLHPPGEHCSSPMCSLLFGLYYVVTRGLLVLFFLPELFS